MGHHQNEEDPMESDDSVSESAGVEQQQQRQVLESSCPVNKDDGSRAFDEPRRAEEA